MTVEGEPSRAVTYGELIGDRQFNLKMTGKAPQKPVSDYKLVGTRVPRVDVPDKVSGKYDYMQHVRVPDMLHGRVVRPRGQGAYGAGARIASVDASSIADIPGARVVRKGDFLGVVAAQEWDAVRAAEKLKVTWDVPPRLPTRRRPVRGDAPVADRRTPRSWIPATCRLRLPSAAHVASATYHGPYQSHAPFAPSCALADVSAERALVMCSTQFPDGVRNMLAQTLGLSAERVRVRYYEGAGVFGRACHDDCALAAAVMSQAVGRPVRVQFMRWDELGWDNYGPAHLADVRAGVDADGRITAFEYHGWHHGWNTAETSQELALGGAGAAAGQRRRAPRQQGDAQRRLRDAECAADQPSRPRARRFPQGRQPALANGPVDLVRLGTDDR